MKATVVQTHPNSKTTFTVTQSGTATQSTTGGNVRTVLLPKKGKSPSVGSSPSTQPQLVVQITQMTPGNTNTSLKTVHLQPQTKTVQLQPQLKTVQLLPQTKTVQLQPQPKPQTQPQQPKPIPAQQTSVAPSQPKPAQPPPQTTNPKPTSTSTSTTPGHIIEACLKSHNDLRAQVRAPPLKWSEELATSARAVATECARRNALQHSSRGGENLWAGSSTDISEMVKTWAAEQQHFNHAGPRKFPDIAKAGKAWNHCGHYSQCIWRETTHVGGAMVEGKNGMVFFCCQYEPKGNMAGKTVY
eukprot:TRINITY_DN22166_c0_g1_i1.p1 TRINITY_DN22166_c0_g1~~TRINITY_DN22166_c0_g1_i1.p1  ORF type:complete len:300 (+),score=57.81 TRINITY_DN22166_c0_g1_i1:33-932(+)